MFMHKIVRLCKSLLYLGICQLNRPEKNLKSIIGKRISIFAQDCKTCIGSQATALLSVFTAHCKSHKSQNLNGCFHEWITKSRFKAP